MVVLNIKRPTFCLFFHFLSFTLVLSPTICGIYFQFIQIKQIKYHKIVNLSFYLLFIVIINTSQKLSCCMSDSHLFRSNVGSATNIFRHQYKQQGWTNSPFLIKQKQLTLVYMPCYVRTKLKNIVSMDPQALKGTLNITIIVSIYYGQFENIYPQLFKQFQSKIILRFKIDPSVRLEEGFHPYENQKGQKCSNYITKKINHEQKLINFSIRKMMTVPLNCQVFWSPFQMIQYMASIIIQSVKFQQPNVNIHFNLMDVNKSHSIQHVASYTQQGALGQYDLAQNLIRAQFSNCRVYQEQLKLHTSSYDSQNQTYTKYRASLPFSRKSEIQEETNQQWVNFRNKKIKSFQYGHFIYPIYRQALGPLFRLFFPIIILGMMNLGVFFQNQRAGKRLLNISAIMVSYVQILPIIRQKLPLTNKLVISQILLFSMACMTLFTLAHTIKIKKTFAPLIPLTEQKDINFFYKMKWHEQELFLTAMILTFTIIGILVYISLLYACYFYRYFNKNADQIKQDIKFDRKDWGNIQCDKYFNKVYQSGVDIHTLDQYEKSKRLRSSIKRQDNNNEDYIQ